MTPTRFLGLILTVSGCSFLLLADLICGDVPLHFDWPDAALIAGTFAATVAALYGYRLLRS